MLSLRQGLGLDTMDAVSDSSWQPSNESCLEAWFKKDTGLTLVDSGGTDYVSNWADSSSNSNDMAQTTASKRPSYSGSPNNELVFPTVSSGDWLTSSSNILLAGEFTLVFKIHPSFPSGTSSSSGYIISDNQSLTRTTIDIGTENEIIWRFAFQPAGFSTITLDAGRTFGDDYLVLTRDGSDTITLWHNGVSQADTNSASGTYAVHFESISNSVVKQFAGTIEEIQAYSCSNATLTSNINSYIAGI